MKKEEISSMNLPKTIPNMTEISLVEAKKFLPESRNGDLPEAFPWEE